MNSVKSWCSNVYKSIWLFPLLLLVPLLIFTCLKINGSSVGILQSLFYGASQDQNLIAGSPQAIRSDEWLVGTQTTVSQSLADYPRVNPDIGNGEDVSLNSSIPYKGWGEAFRPQNLAYFVLPLANAFAFQWWLIGYLLIVSCYVFILTLLPSKRLLAAMLSSALFFSAFLQWWYQYGTLASIYYPLFIATAVVHLTKQKQRIKKILLCVAISYLLICFALILYPPFQIACGLALAAFLVGFLWQEYPKLGKRNFLVLLGSLAISAFGALIIVVLFMLTSSDSVEALVHTSYPGARSSHSGDFNVVHLLASQLGYQFTSVTRTMQFHMAGVASNQSEASNFLLLSPLLVIPILVLMYKDWRNHHYVDRILAVLLLCFIIFLFHLVVPFFSPLAKFLLLDKVPTARLLIGLGILNIFIVVSLIRRAVSKPKLYWFPARFIIIYTLAVLVLELFVNLYVHETSGIFVGVYRAIAFALPLPLIVYALLRKWFVAASVLYLAFSFFISFRVNPLYRGLDLVTKNPISQAMLQASRESDKRWATDSVITENLAPASGLPSLSGVYYYPQKSLWSSIPDANYKDYNRYAHVTFGFFTDSTKAPQLKLVAQDQVRITTGICNAYLRQENVGFVLTSQVLTGACISRTTPVQLPASTLYIYTLAIQ